MKAGDVMTREVVTVGPDTPVLQVVKLLLARGISGVPVVDEDAALVGVVSEGDLMRRVELGTQKRRGGWREFFTGTATLAEDYVRSHGVFARDVMTRDVVSVTIDTEISDIADLMEARRIKRVPVLQDGKLVGIVSRSNLLRAFASQETDASAPVHADDASIRAALLTELGRETWSRRAENTVVVTDGVVHLWGLVATPEELRALELVAQGVPGVKSVRNHMIVLSEEPYPLFPGSFAA
ncbi:CBS domain-containing protein [Rhodovastum atsumiense]|uniref:CBS domain-containing protein n=1 Tax=Rhodovastum atsumiense TaxID=504468 RepID=A0A5M6IN73_9PROT|nr:CBS domain-containing protein [Rhodovastum atsumiense]KAA5609713.1 CBS domain-containing protein [Rhodovastum atsumiense]CAH2604482.1 CBS domain-containing protein [Rhodovastum atsumiense]